MEAESVTTEDQLPETLQELAEVIGLEETLLVVRHFGGIRIYIPRDAAGHSLADVLGADALAALTRVYGGDRIEVPKGAKLVRDAVIRQRHYGTDGTDGENAMQLARAFFLTERQVRRILAAG